MIIDNSSLYNLPPAAEPIINTPKAGWTTGSKIPNWFRQNKQYDQDKESKIWIQLLL